MTRETNQISDGFHTFGELYDHRISLFLALMAAHPEKSWFSRYHEDGKFPFDDPSWFIAGINFGPGLNITYHLPISDWIPAWDTGARALPVAEKWDGHTPGDVVDRLRIVAKTA